MNIKIPKQNTSLKFERHQLPQIAGRHVSDFIASMKKDGIRTNQHLVEPLNLKPTQSEFNHEKVKKILHTDDSKLYPSLSSSDGYILDGHHRWIADHNKGSKHETLTVDLPIHALIKRAHNYHNSFTKTITEQRKQVIYEALREYRY